MSWQEGSFFSGFLSVQQLRNFLYCNKISSEKTFFETVGGIFRPITNAWLCVCSSEHFASLCSVLAEFSSHPQHESLHILLSDEVF